MRQVQRGRGRAAERAKATATRRRGRTAWSRTTPGFKEAFRQFAEGGWQGLQHPADFGGQGLPKTIGAACIEMLNSANLSFALCPLLTDGAIEALLTAGSRRAARRVYLPKHDLRRVDRHDEPDRAAGRLRPRAGAHARRAAGRRHATRSSAPRSSSPTASTTWPRTSSTWCWRASTGAPEGVKGISLFVVPKFMVNADGSLGARNDVHCVSIEHKLGIKASPTAVLQFGDHGRRRRLPGRPGEPRPRVHVHHDERRALRGRRAGHRDRRARLPEGGGVRQGPRAVAAGRRLAARQRADHPPPRRASAC